MARKMKRASCPVDFIEGPVYWTMVEEGTDGCLALFHTFAINLQAKKQQNKGVFRQPITVIAVETA